MCYDYTMNYIINRTLNLFTNITKQETTCYIGIGISLFFLYSCRKHLITRNKLYLRILDQKQIDLNLRNTRTLSNGIEIVGIIDDDIDDDDDDIVKM